MKSKYQAFNLRRVICALLAVLSLSSNPAIAADSELAGLWESHRILGPAESGPLLIRQVGDRFLAELGGHRVEVSVNEGSVSFGLSNGARFQGEMEASGDIRGHWLQARSKLDGNVFATPVSLRRQADGWYGHITPQPDTATFFLLLREEDGELAAELINPDRNLGLFNGLTRVVRDGDAVSLMGSFLGRGQERVMLRGTYFPDEEVLGLRYPGRGGGYDFRRVEPDAARGFLARTSTSNLLLSPPMTLNDGWETASPAEVGIDVGLVEEMIRTHILATPASTRDLSIHALLIARNGKLAVEEYFHGYHRDLPHDSRSASKSVAAILAAAVMQSGVNLDWDTPVYPLFDTAELLQREPARGDITLRHLVNMNSGLDCDDRNPESAAFEDYLWDHADELDFYEHTINVDVVHAPG
jgi:hypothetical protein